MIDLGVLGDTHGSLAFLNEAKKAWGSSVASLLHTGDFYADGVNIGEQLAIEVFGVTGNCDRLSEYPQERVLEFADKRIVLTHGHLYGVKKGLLNLFYRGKELGADAVVFGHTHIPFIQEVEGILLFNPGSLSRPRNGVPTCGLLRIESGKIEAEYCSLNQIKAD